MEHELRKPTRTFNIVPGVVLDSLVSMSKFIGAGYFNILDEEEANVYDARTTTVATSKPPVIKRWWEAISTLWRIPLVKRDPGPDDGQVTSRVPGACAAS